jgi:diguanylate cyclase (GGDEF)-like protein
MPVSKRTADRVPRTIPGQALFRLRRRLLADEHFLLAVALAVGAVVIALAGGETTVEWVLLTGLVFVGIQAAIAAITGPTRRRRVEFLVPVVRFLMAVLFVTAVNGFIGDSTFRPAAVLYIPIVALAAAFGATQAVIVGGFEIAIYLARVVFGNSENAASAAQRAIGLMVVTIVLSFGIRRTVQAMTLAMTRLRVARARDRRRTRQICAVEAVGHLLAATGPTDETLDRVVGLLEVDLGYNFVSVYLGEVGSMRLAAHRGYESVIDTFDGSTGVMGRVMRTGEVAFIPDVSLDPDYVSADDSIKAEISAPLKVGSELIGVVNVEAAQINGLDKSDRETILLVADRLASALALARERGRLETRAELFRRLAIFSSIVNGTLDTDSLYHQIVHAIPDVIDVDHAVLTVLDRATGRYRIQAVAGSDDKLLLGVEITAGEGMAGRAIRDRAAVVDNAFSRDRYSRGVKDHAGPDAAAGVAMPLIRDDVVVGALSLGRDPSKPFRSSELEVLPILAGLAALAVTNTLLHAEVTETSVRDALSGLFNRRHLDAVLGQMNAVRARLALDDRNRVSVILFDLDRFGSFNKRYGHQTGDAVIRQFADVLRARMRGEDLVARYGGEEFVVVLVGANLDEATQIAEEIRNRFATADLRGPDGSLVSATVSAGCAAMGADLGTFPELLSRADMALAIAKHGGRNRVVTA